TPLICTTDVRQELSVPEPTDDLFEELSPLKVDLGAGPAGEVAVVIAERGEHPENEGPVGIWLRALDRLNQVPEDVVMLRRIRRNSLKVWKCNRHLQTSRD